LEFLIGFLFVVYYIVINYSINIDAVVKCDNARL